MKNRFLALILALFMCLAMFGCEAEAPVDSATETSATETSATEISEASIESTESLEAEQSELEQSETETSDSEEDASVSQISPVLYKASDNEGNVVWLFGSIHVGRDDYYPLPDYVLDAFESSDALAVELDIVAFENDMNSQVEALQSLVYIDGTTIKDHIPAETYNNAVEIFKANNLYNNMLDYYKPSMWSGLVDNCAYDRLNLAIDLGIDRHLINLARKSDKEILEVESAEFQYGMMGNFSEELQIYLLEESIESYGDLTTAKREIKKLMDLWASGDESKISKYLSEEEEIDDQQEALLYEEYYNAMIVSRNNSMTEYAENAMKSGKEVFICVGAAHVVGKGAIAENLRELGYTVEMIQQ